MSVFLLCLTLAYDDVPSMAIAVDLDLHPDSLDKDLFPGLPEEAQVHGGFQDAFIRSSDEVFPEIQRLMAEHNTNNITVVSAKYMNHEHLVDPLDRLVTV